MLEDKLLPVLKNAFFWSEENVILNIIPTLDGVWVSVCPVIFWNIIKFSCIIWQMLSHMFIKAYGLPWQALLSCILWQMLLQNTVADVIAIFYVVDGLSIVEMICHIIKQGGRCCCHCYVWQMVSHISWLQSVLADVITMVADGWPPKVGIWCLTGVMAIGGT